MLNFIMTILPLLALIGLILVFPKWRHRKNDTQANHGLRKISITTKTFRPGKGGSYYPRIIISMKGTSMKFSLM